MLNMGKIRYFIGLPPDTEVQEQLAQQAKEQEPTLHFAKWTHPQDYHITLAFLGDLEASKAEEVRDVLSKHTFHTSTFSVHTSQWGCFGPPKKPSILWAGIESSDELKALHAEVWSLMETVGFEREQRPFRPHLTIARRSQGSTAADVKSAHLPSLSWQVRDVVLFQTHFGRRPAYEQVLTLPLG